MSRRNDILEEMHRIEQLCVEYRNNIKELEAGYKYLELRRSKIEIEVHEPEKACDMTYGSRFRGKLETESEQYQEEVIRQIEIAQNDVLEFMGAIQRAIERLSKLIEEGENKIDALVDEVNLLASIDSEAM